MATLSVIYKIAADISGLKDGIDKTAASTDRLVSMAATAGKALTAAFSIVGVEQAAMSFINFAGHLTDLSQKTGIGTTALQKLDLAFSQNGVSLDTVTSAIEKLSKNIIGGDKTAVGALQKLGLSLVELKSLAPDELFIRVADKIGAIANPTEKAYAAMAIFGKGGVELLSGLDGHLAETTKHFEDMGLIIDEQTIKAADDFGDQLLLMGKQLMGIVATILGPLLPALSAIGEALMWLGANVIGPVLNVTIKSLIQLLGMLWDGFAQLLGRMAELSTHIPIVGKHLGFMADASEWLGKSSIATNAYLKNMWGTTEKVGETAKKVTPALIGLGEMPDGPLKSLLKNLEDMAAKLTPLPGRLVLVGDQVKAFGQEAMKLVEDATAMGVVAPESVRKIAAAWNDVEVKKIVGKVTETWTKDLIKFNEDAAQKMEVGTKAIGDAISKNYFIAKDAHSEALGLINERTMTSFDMQREAVNKWVREHKAAVDTTASNAKSAFDQIDKYGVEAFTNIDIAEQKAMDLDFTGPINQVGELARKLKPLQSVFDAVDRVLSNISGTFVEVAAVGLRAASEISKVASAASEAGDGFTKGDWLKVAAIGVSALATAFGKLFGNNEEKKINPIRQAFVDLNGGLASLNEKAHAAGATLDAMLNARNPEAYKKAIDDLNAALQFQDDAMKTLDATVAKYGFTIEQLGPAFAAQKLSEQAGVLLQDYQVLTAAGVDHLAILDKMAPSVQDYVNKSLLAGVAIPEAMRPLLQSMVDAGLLTDAAGNKMTDLAGLTFTETLDKKFTTLIDTINKLADAIARGVGGAIASIPTDRTIHIGYQYDAYQPPDRQENFAATGGLVTATGIQHFAAGGNVLPFRPMGSDTVPAMLTPGEMVLTQGQQRAVFGGRGRGESSAALLSELRGLRADNKAMRKEMAEQRRSLPRAIRDAVKLAS